MAVFDLEAVIKLSDSGFKQGLSKAGAAVGKFAKATGAALLAGGAAVATLTTASVKAYADYEQLAGGVEKLFGKEASSTMMQYAQNAYKTAGMSANQFMEQSTSFAAALIQSYSGDTAKAADQANKAMTAISDNFNTFGGDIQSVQSAFQGFAKQNYTMLDNLKLGYGGTKSEMERLIADANEYAAANGKAADLSIENFGDIVEAIDLIQQKQNIAGTTAKEASTTISGSVGMMKAAWQNLLVAFGDKDADLGQYFSALTDSAETAFGNILPVAEQAITGISEVIVAAAPMIGEKLPTLIQDVLPNLIEAGGTLITALITGIGTALPLIVDALPEIWEAIKTGFAEAWPAMKEAGVKLLHMVGEGISSAWGWIKGKASEIWDGIKESVSSSWESIKGKASDVWNGVKSTISGVWDGIKSTVTSKVDAVKSKITSGFNAAKGTVTSVWNSIKTTISSVMDGIKEKIQSAIDTVKSIVNFSWSLPKLKLPHFSISGSFGLNPPSVPKLSVTWNKRALNEPFMFSNATLFGAGEAGDEVLYGRSNLMDDIREASAARNDALLAKMDAIFAVVAQYLPEAARKELYLDGDLLVGGTRAKMDNQLGELDGYGRRGVSIA